MTASALQQDGKKIWLPLCRDSKKTMLLLLLLLFRQSYTASLHRFSIRKGIISPSFRCSCRRTESRRMCRCLGVTLLLVEMVSETRGQVGSGGRLKDMDLWEWRKSFKPNQPNEWTTIQHTYLTHDNAAIDPWVISTSTFHISATQKE